MIGSNTPLVSVIIPARNRADLLARAIASVRAQTMADLNIIVVDDASDPDLESFADKNTDVQFLRNTSRAGAQRSRLIGATAARGEYLALLDSDDWWVPEKLERQLAMLRSGQADIASCRVVAVRGSFQKSAPWRPLGKDERVEDFLYVERGMLQTSTVVARREVLTKLLNSSANSFVHNDTMLFLEAQRCQLRILQMPDALSFFDDNPRPDRISYDVGRVAASEAWFQSVSKTWSPQARRGFHVTDMVPRFVNTGQRQKALICLITAYHPKISSAQYLKKLAYIMFNGSPSALVKRLGDRVRSLKTAALK